MDSHLCLCSALILTALASLLLHCCRRLLWPWLAAVTAHQHGAGPPLPPGNLGFPWVGESLPFLAAIRAGDHDRFLRERTARYRSPTFKTLIFNDKTVMIQGPAANRFIATSENKGLLRNAWPSSILNIVGRRAPVALHGAEHSRLRRILLRCLSPSSKLVSRTHTLTLLHFADPTVWQHGQQLKLVPLLKRHTFRLACNLLANISNDHVLSRLLPHFEAWLTGMLHLPLDLPGTSYRRSKLSGDILRQEMSIMINRRLKHQLMKLGCLDSSTTELHNSQEKLHDGQEKERKEEKEEEDVLSVLLKDQEGSGGFLTQTEMEDLLLFLLFAGHDTTTAALTFALKFLEQNPACLERVVEEQEGIASEKKAGEMLDWSDVQKMRYTWRVIQETMRLRPPVTAGMKEATEDLVFEGYHIPKGWKVYLSVTSSHSDATYFPDATAFDPSRFEAQIPPHAYVPFGVGPHACPGSEFARMSICVYLHVLVRHFKWVSLKQDEKVSIATFPTLVEGYPVTVTQRKPNSRVS